MTDSKNWRRLTGVRVVAYLGAVFAASWLLTYFVAATRIRMVDWVLAFVLSLLVAVLLWTAGRRHLPPQAFWLYLATAWTANILGNLAWGVYALWTGRALPDISWVDGLFLLRYALIWAAYWRFALRPSRRQAIRLAAALLAAALVLAADIFLNWPTAYEGDPWPLLAGMVYPILDAGLIYTSLRAWVQRPGGRLGNALGTLALAMIICGMAGWLNFHAHLTSSEMALTLTGFFWPLSDILAGLAVFHLLDQAPGPTKNGARPELRSI